MISRRDSGHCPPFNRLGAWALAAALATAAFPRLAKAQSAEFCSFEVSVSAPNGAPIPSAPVVFAQDGVPFAESVTDSVGIARLCDPPPGLIDVEVGGHLCGATSIRHLSAYWMETRRVRLVYDNCSGEHLNPPSACELVIRAHDQRGVPLAGVQLRVVRGPVPYGKQTEESDSVGRIFRLVPFGETLVGQLSLDGYMTLVTAFQCKTGQASRREITVELQKR